MKIVSHGRLAPLLFAFLLACGATSDSGLPRGTVTIAGTTVAVDVARTGEDRAQGLSGRSELAHGEGMLFVHEAPGRHGYWMRDMHFEIDILWLRAGRIVDVAHRVKPEPADTPSESLPVYRPRADADLVLEVPAGFARAHGWDPGVRVTVELADG